MRQAVLTKSRPGRRTPFVAVLALGFLGAAFAPSLSTAGQNCTIRFSMTSVGAVGDIQFNVGYGEVMGEFPGAGDAAPCTSLVAGTLDAFNNIDDRLLTLHLVADLGIAAPADLVQCTFIDEGATTASDFFIEVGEGNATIVVSDLSCQPMPECGNLDPEDGEECDDGNASSTDSCIDCVIARCGDAYVFAGVEQCDDGDMSFSAGDYCTSDCSRVPCGHPANPGSAKPKASDALFVLRAAVALAACDARVCDVNSSGSVSTADALLVLRAAVGTAVELVCPA
jgi:hypothetical protein